MDKGRVLVTEKVTMPLLFMSPINKGNEGDVESSHAIVSDTETHIRQL